MPQFFRQVNQLDHGKSAVSCLKYTDDGVYCMSGASDIKLWNPDRGLLIKTYNKVSHHGSVLDLAIGRDSARFLSCGNDRAACLWDISTGKCLRRLEGHGGRINCVGLGGLQQSVAMTGSYDCTLRIFDLRSPNVIQIISDFTDSVTSLVLASDKGQNATKKPIEHLLIAASVDGFCRSYDLRKGLLTSDNIGIPITNIALSRDGACIALSSLDSALHLLEIDSGTRLNVYTGHTHENYALKAAFSYDDAILASPSENGHILLWRLVEADILHDLVPKLTKNTSQTRRPTSAVAWHPNKPNFLVASYDGTVSCWHECDQSLAHHPLSSKLASPFSSPALHTVPSNSHTNSSNTVFGPPKPP